MPNEKIVFFDAQNSGWSDPKNPSWFSTTGINYATKEESEIANEKHKKHHKNCHIKYRILKTTVLREVV